MPEISTGPPHPLEDMMMNDTQDIMLSMAREAKKEGIPKAAATADPVVIHADRGMHILNERNERIADIGEAIQKNTAMLVREYSKLCLELPKLEEKTRDHIKKVNNLTSQVSQSLAKSKTIMGEQVEERLKQLERFVECLERIENLQDSGVMDRFYATMRK